jgi:hypothetical protein
LKLWLHYNVKNKTGQFWITDLTDSRVSIL